MMFLSLDSLPALGLGLAVGLVSSILGLGGGVLIVPALPLLFAVSQQSAIATSLFTIFFVVSVNSYFFHRKGLINWRIAVVVGSVAAVFAFLAGQATFYVSEQVLRLVLATLMVVFSLRVLAGRRSKMDAIQESSSRVKGVSLFAAGTVAGALSGFSGVGAGLLLNPIMLHYRWVANIRVSPTANAIMVFTTLFGGLSFLWAQWSGRAGAESLIRWDYVVLISAGAWVAAIWGRKIQHKLSEDARKWTLCLLLLAMAIQLFVRTV